MKLARGVGVVTAQFARHELPVSPAVVAQQDHLTIVVGELGHGVVEQCADLIPERTLVDPGLTSGGFDSTRRRISGDGTVDPNFSPAVALLSEVEIVRVPDPVDRDPGQPSEEVGVAEMRIIAEILCGGLQSLLHHVH